MNAIIQMKSGELINTAETYFEIYDRLSNKPELIVITEVGESEDGMFHTKRFRALFVSDLSSFYESKFTQA